VWRVNLSSVASCLYTILASPVPYIRRGPNILKSGHVTITPSLGVIIRWIVLAIVNLCTKFEMSRVTHYKFATHLYRVKLHTS